MYNADILSQLNLIKDRLYISILYYIFLIQTNYYNFFKNNISSISYFILFYHLNFIYFLFFIII